MKAANAIDSIAISPDGRLLASGNGDFTVSLWDMKTGKHIRTIPAKQTVATGSQAVQFAPDGKVLATAGWGDGKVRLWDVGTGKMIKAFGVDSGLVNWIAYAPDGKTFASSEGGTVRLWDLATGKQHREWQAGQGNLAFTPDGKSLAWCGGKQVVLQAVPRD